MKQKILITRPMFPDVVEKLKQYFDVTLNEGSKFSPDELIEALKDKEGVLVAGGEKFNERTIAPLPNLKAVCVSAAGYNNIDVSALTKAGVIVTNAPGEADETVADFSWALIIASSRNLLQAERYIREGNWNASVGKKFFGMDVHGKTLGIIGMGRIGQSIAKRASGFSVRVIYHNRHRLDTSIEQEYKAVYKTKEALLQEADYVVLALPLTKNNYHIVGAKELELMKTSSILINIARGGLVDEAALADALRQNKIAGAALDVFEEEPKIHPELFYLPNVILTPHIAGATERAQHGLASVGADNLIAALGHGPHAFHPPAIINPEVL